MGGISIIADMRSDTLESTTKYELNNPNFWREKGDDLFNQQEYDKAIKCYDVSISLHDQNPDAWNRKGIAFIKLGKVEEALFCRSQLNAIIADMSITVKEPSGTTRGKSIQPEVSSIPNILDSPSLKPFNPFTERRKREIEDID